MDLYVVLGVGRGASPADLKRAYRRLARRHHPDLNPGDREADVRFQRIVSAYETLIDPERRRRYDAGERDPASPPPAPGGSFGFAGFDFSAASASDRRTTFGELFEDVLVRRGHGQARGGERGADLVVRASLSFADAWRGCGWPAMLTRQVACPSCNGWGERAASAPVRCLHCDGAGSVRSTRGHMIFAKACARCHGAGQLERVPCRQCAGQGVQTRTDVVSVAIPAGIADGMRVRVPGEGHAGVRGAASGDLYVEVDVLDDPLFQRRGNDVYAVLPVAVHEAALGARVMVPTPNGPVRVRVLPGTQSGQHLRVRGRGLPLPGSEQRGDLVFEVQVRLPGSLSDRSRALVEEFGRLNPESVRDDRFRVE